jgi:hypothetical protein
MLEEIEGNYFAIPRNDLLRANRSEFPHAALSSRLERGEEGTRVSLKSEIQYAKRWTNPESLG